MADYYPVLKRAISSLPSGSGEARRAVYEKARVALLRQLSSYNPPLSPTEIADQRVALEDCIRRVEAEVAGVAEPAPAPVEAAPPPPPTPAPAPKAEPAPQPVPEPQPQREPPQQREPRASLGHDDAPPPFRKPVPAALTAPEMNPFRHIEPLTGRTEASPRIDSPFHDTPAPPVQADRPRLPTARLPDEHTEPRIGVGVSALTRTLKQADALGAASSTAVRVARNAMDEPVEPGPSAQRVEPEVGDVRPVPRQIPLSAAKSERIEPVRAQREGATLPWAEEATRSTSPLKMILAGLAVVLVLIIGGTAFVFRDALSSLIAGQPDTEASAKPAEGGDGLAPKILDRLPAEGDVAAPPVAPDAKTVQTETVSPSSTVDPDLPPPPGGGATGPNLADATPPSATADAAPPALALTPTTPSTTTSAPAAGQTIGVAQKAILYEEPIPGSPGTRLEGTVVWSFVNEPTLPGEKPVPQIRGEIEVPDLSLKMRLSIHKNDDQALPASHIVEFAFDVPASFPGKFIDTTPGMIAKQTEEARGDPIVGAVAKVSDSLFWLALSGLDQDVSRNIQLLKERAWIDIPIRYGNRRRAILTFEKGAPGEKAFADAFAAWGQ